MAAQDAELQLKVSLDLSFFRQQLATLGSAAAGYQLPVNVKFDRSSLTKQLTLLSNSLSRKKYDVEVKSTSLEALLKQVDTFKNTLAALKTEDISLDVKVEADISKTKGSEARRNIINAITGGPGKAIVIPTAAKDPLVKNIDEVRASIKRKLGTIEVDVKASLAGGAADSDAIKKKILGETEAIALPLQVTSPNRDNIRQVRADIKEKLSGIKIQVQAELSGAALKSTGAAKTPENYSQAQLRKLGQDIKPLYRAAADAGLVEFNKTIANNIQEIARELSGISRDSIAGLLNGLKSGEPQIKAAAKSLGQALIVSIKDVLGIASPSREFKKIGQNVGEGFQQGMMSSIDKAFDAVEGLMRARMKVLDTIARGMFRMVGIDPAAIRAEAAQRRALPGVNFPATVPPRNISIGPSGTGRALPPGAIPSALPGTAFGAQRYLPTALSDELKQILRGAAFAFVDSLKQQIRSVRVGLSATQQPLLGASRIAGLLPAGIGRAPSVYSTGAIGGETRAEMMARREREARVRSALRGMDVMGGGAGRPPSPYSYAYRSARPTGAIVPYAAPGAIVPQPRAAGEQLRGQATPFASPLPKSYLEIGKIIKGIDPILQRSSVPFSGAIRELGEEFSFAIKQVLLFGTAYKALAFFMDLPAQALRASTALQSFNNQLNAITGGAPQAARSMAFINNTVERFNVPLQSAREGFLRLYASMSPAGMDAGTIENLFVGISQASATLGLSADQVDRVTYAFSQMASKGKVMSEEVTGQLGDVIPGALSLMADAAGMSMADFKQAMEDGLVSGKAMEQLFTNLPIVLEQRFGKGAAGAAQTLQGQLNDLATSTTRLYEAFEPIVNSIAGVVLPALSAGLADAQSAVAAFGMKIEGINPATNLLSENAQNIYRNLEIVADTASSLISVIQSLGGVFSAFGNILSGALQLFNAIAGNPVGEFFVKLAVNIGLATAAINLLVTQGIIRAISNFALMVGNIQLTIGALKTLISTSRAAKIAVGGIVAGGIMVGLEALVTHISRAREETEKLRRAALLTADALKQMSYQQLVAEERSVQSRISKLEQLQAAAGPGLQIKNFSQQQEAMALELGLPITGRAGQRAISLTRAEGLRQQLLGELPRIRGEMKGRFEGPASMAAITPIDLAAGEGKAKAEKGRVSLDRLVSAQFAQRAALLKSEAALAREETAAMAPDTVQAERMLKYYTQFREQLIDMATIQAQIEDAEKNRSAYIQDGMNASQLDYNIQQLRNELQVRALDLVTIEQKYKNQARKDSAKQAEEEEKEMQKRIDQQKEMNRLLEDARIQAGLISPAEAAGILQRREFEDAQARFAKAGGDPSQLAGIQAAIPQAGSIQESIKNLRDELNKLLSTQEMVKFSANSIGEAFANSFKDAITGAATAQEALAGFFQSLGSAFADMAAQMIQKMIQMYILNQFLNILPGMGSFAGGAKIGQSVSMPTGAGIGAGGGILQNSMGQGFGTFGPNFGIRQFANGGMVTGPTLGLIGEGRYNEAVVPLPDGKTIPVDLGGAAGNQIVSNITVNVNNGQAQSNANGSNSSELGRKLEGAVKQVIVGELRPGGLLAR